ncbi:MAG: hypothetical protein JXA21_13570 [Anaerolineae bacterium]|nr:hypothetical protein [Anaerolineae bacterium]
MRYISHQTKKHWLKISSLLLLVFLTSCQPMVDVTQGLVSNGRVLLLTSEHVIGQTFVARRTGLNGIKIWLDAHPGSSGEIYLHLAPGPYQDDILVTSLSLTQIAGPQFQDFTFSPLPDSLNRDYYIWLEFVGSGEVQVGMGLGDTYIDGALYENHQPLDAQMAFLLHYAPGYIGVSYIRALGLGMGLLGAVALLYGVPGWALQDRLLSKYPLSIAERLGIASSLSLALYPLLFLWTDMVGLHLGALYMALPVLFGSAYLVWRYRAWRPRLTWQKVCARLRTPDLAAYLALGGVSAIIIAVRLLPARAIDAPLWGDGYQHTLIAQLMVDNQGLFSSWEPYLPLQTFTYHFGFHTLIAVFHWLTRIEITQATLWVGQIVNILAVLNLYPLAVRMSGQRWVGILVLLIAGLLSPMPMYYINWGRYTQLSAQAILPIAILATWRVLEMSRRDWRWSAVIWLIVGGLALHHYRVVVFYGVFVLSWLLFKLPDWRRALSRTGGLAVGVGMLCSPWFIRTFAGRIFDYIQQYLMVNPAQISKPVEEYSTWIGALDLYLGPFLWLLMALAVGIGFWRRDRGVRLLATWWAFLFILTNPKWFNLPGNGLISNFAIFIAAYIPASLLVGNLAGYLIRRLPPRGWRTAVLLIAIGGFTWIGSGDRPQDIQIAWHNLVTRPDLHAMDWIREHTSPEAHFLINGFFVYDDGSSVMAGSDGGTWLPVLAQRTNTVPPLVGDIEQWPWVGYQDWLSAVYRQLYAAGVDDPTTLAMLEERGVTHVYIGQLQGRRNYTGPDILDPQAFLVSHNYQLVYQRDRVWIFEIRQ